MHAVSFRLFLCLGFLAGCAETVPSEPAEQVPLVQPELQPEAAPQSTTSAQSPSWARELAQLDQEIERFEGLAESRPGDWLSLGNAAGLLLDRARLTGSYDDYARAEAHLAEAFKRAPPTSGPIATRAAMNFSLHRLDRVAEDLKRLEALPALIRPKPQVLALRKGALAFQLGQYAEARQQIQSAVSMGPSHPNLATLALYFWKTGDFDTAEQLYRQALTEYHGLRLEPIAWTHLQLGLMDLERGRWSEAQQHYEDASRTMPGWYLVDEHIAEILLLQGKTDEAIVIYKRVIQATGNPEFMDAMAGIEQERGNSEAARSWVDRAGPAYAAQLARFPEAAYGHALDHFVEFGSQQQALDLAEKNHAIRPNGEAKTALAGVYLAAERQEDANRLVEEALATPYRTAELHAVAAEVFGAGKLPEKAAQQRSKALAIDPHSMD